MDILHYTVDIKHLLQVQDQQTQINDLKERKTERQGIENKKRLLKYVLPFMHGVYALHNNMCKKTKS
jgi:IS4 transposase